MLHPSTEACSACSTLWNKLLMKNIDISKGNGVLSLFCQLHNVKSLSDLSQHTWCLCGCLLVKWQVFPMLPPQFSVRITKQGIWHLILLQQALIWRLGVSRPRKQLTRLEWTLALWGAAWGTGGREAAAPNQPNKSSLVGLTRLQHILWLWWGNT